MDALSRARVALQIVVLALLGACAGGGGGPGGAGGALLVSPPPPPVSPPGTPRPPPVAVPALPAAAAPGTFPASNSQEFLNNWGPGGIRAQAAWRFQNAHGEGVVIGVVDDGIDPNHPELVGRVDTVNSKDINAGRNALTTTLSHGSELASLMVGNFNGSQTVGVAYEATVLAVRADDGTGSFSDTDLAAALNYAVSKGVDVVNFSLGGPGSTSQPLRNAIQAATAAGVILVFSAGNDGPGATSPNFPAQLAADPTISNGLILVAGGSDPGGAFNTRSNQAGVAANQYLVAPGWEIIVPDHGPAGPVPGFQSCGVSAGLAPDLCRIQGTSYASPHVAGAVAVLMSAFPGLTPSQVVQIILQTTDDMGAAGIDTQTGWGHLNLERAFGPIGSASAPLAGASGGGEINPTQTLGIVGQAFGDGLTRQTAAWTVAAFDGFGRAYDVNFSGNWARAAAGPSAIVEAPSLWRAREDGAARMELALTDNTAPESYRTMVDRAELEQAPARIEANLSDGLSISFAGHGARADRAETGEPVGHLASVPSEASLQITQRVGDSVRLSLISESGAERAGFGGDRQERSATAARAAFDLGALGFDVTAGRLDEAAGLLGLAWARELGATPDGETEFAGVAGHIVPAPGWRLSASAEYGVSDLAGAGWLSIDERLRTSAYALEVSRWATPAWLDVYGPAGEGLLSLSLSQPLRVDGGRMSFLAPTATIFGRQSLSFERRSFEPTPSGRETRVALGYRYFAGDVFSAFGELVYVAEPGHVRDADSEGLARFGVRVRH